MTAELAEILLSCLATMNEKGMLTPSEINFSKSLKSYLDANGFLTVKQFSALRKMTVRVINDRPVPGIEC